MTNVFLASCFLICYLGFFSFGHSLLGVERGFSGLGFGPVATAVMLYDEAGLPEAFPYYSPFFVKKNVKEYAEKSIAPYTKEYTLSYAFLNASTNRVDALTPTKVRIRLKATIGGVYAYERIATFQIQETGNE